MFKKLTLWFLSSQSGHWVRVDRGYVGPLPLIPPDVPGHVSWPGGTAMIDGAGRSRPAPVCLWDAKGLVKSSRAFQCQVLYRDFLGRPSFQHQVLRTGLTSPSDPARSGSQPNFASNDVYSLPLSVLAFFLLGLVLCIVLGFHLFLS